ncbi:hypothetical protein [Amycolatopsis nigrescens]|uniref:hypothetical protein n=1 Tax=Amycolatopsis nigrescens TaxID=381445 RepID=UPI000366A0B2|nr:hypothetical protein [Amycolatopsis nigrescens]
MCGYRRCAAVLPLVTGRGNRARFCQDGKTWGTRNLSCREAEAAMVDVDSLRDDSTALDGTAVAALGEQVDRALAPAEALLQALTEARGQLDATVADALADREAARAEAADQQRLRGVAEARAADAADEAAEAAKVAESAVRDRSAAERQRDTEHRARIEAEQAQQRADGRAAAMQDERDRARGQAEAVLTRVAELDRSLAATTAELAALHSTLGEEQTRTTAAVQRAQAAEDKLATDLAAQAETQRAQVEQLETRHAKELDRARADFERVRDRLEADLAAGRRSQEESLAGLHTTINTLNRELGAAQHSREQAAAQAKAADNERTRLVEAVRGSLDVKDLPEDVRALL